MLPATIRVAATTELGLSLNDAAGWLHDKLPLGGSACAQLGIVLGAGVLAHEAVALVKAASRGIAARRAAKTAALAPPKE